VERAPLGRGEWFSGVALVVYMKNILNEIWRNIFKNPLLG
jgi:hypothetical protein